MAAYTLTILYNLDRNIVAIAMISVPIQFEEDKSTNSTKNGELWCHRAVSLSEKTGCKCMPPILQSLSMYSYT